VSLLELAQYAVDRQKASTPHTHCLPYISGQDVSGYELLIHGNIAGFHVQNL